MVNKTDANQNNTPKNQDQHKPNILDVATLSTGFYIPQKEKLLRSYSETANLVRDFVESIYGAEFADTVYQDALEEYEKLIPDIPHLEGRLTGQLNSFLMITAQEVAAWKAMKKHGRTPAETWDICHEAITRRMKTFSKTKRWLLNKLMYSRVMLSRIKKRAETNTHLKSGDFEVAYVIGDGIEFDYEVDYVACGNYKFVQDQGVAEFAPYVCMSDIALGTALGWGLTRTQTLADGCDLCDFRFKKGGNLRISSKTPEVQATIDRISEKEAGLIRKALLS